ncbi:pyrroline-5-carboxylate reductase dimerization domain-containing protein [Paenibacillus sp. FSL H8-0537]|uniref:pyrroline-5-carboxylate reductase dimerization domain-containing protein n=1 Tax=Paenibacillus sp. FSL H8-0537 TaxID=2921399 RepID=UPI0031015843
MNIGIIGYGNIGRLLCESFLERGLLKPEHLIIHTRSPKKLEIINKYPSIQITHTPEELAQRADLLFLCVKPLEIGAVMAQISDHLHGTHLVSTAASIEIRDLEAYYDAKITKIIPTLTSQVKVGMTLVCHNQHVKEVDIAALYKLLQALGDIKRIEEDDFEAAADLTSCAPGLIASMFDEFVASGVRHSRLTREEAEEMVITTLYGTVKLLYEQKMRFDELVTKVATKGGITQEGVNVLRSGLPAVFDEVFERTLEKHHLIKAMSRQNKPIGAK